MAKVIDIMNHKNFKKCKLDRLIEKSLYHDDENVLEIWQTLVKEYINKYPGVPSPSGTLNLVVPIETEQALLDIIAADIEQYIQEYVSDVKRMMLNMLGDIILLQREVAEKRVSDRFL